MSWSYSAAAIETDLNWVRLRVGDTDTNDQQLSDEEINSLLAVHNDKRIAAAAAANAIAAKYTRYGAQKEADAFRALALQIATEVEPSYL